VGNSVLDIARRGVDKFLTTVSSSVINLELLFAKGRDDGRLSLIIVRREKLEGLLTGLIKAVGIVLAGLITQDDSISIEVKVLALGFIGISGRMILIPKKIGSTTPGMQNHGLERYGLRANRMGQPGSAAIAKELGTERRETRSREHIVLIRGFTVGSIKLRRKRKLLSSERDDLGFEAGNFRTNLVNLIDDTRQTRDISGGGTTKNNVTLTLERAKIITDLDVTRNERSKLIRNSDEARDSNCAALYK
jgi:hypothetical protein